MFARVENAGDVISKDALLDVVWKDVSVAEQMLYKIRFYDFSTLQSSGIAATDKPPILDSPGLSAAADGKTILYDQSDQNANSIMLAEIEKIITTNISA